MKVILNFTCFYAIFCLTLIGGSHAFANLLLYEGFTAGTDPTQGHYVPGSDDRYRLGGQNPTTLGFSGAWTEVSSGGFELGGPSLTLRPSLVYEDGLGNFVGTSGHSAFRIFDTTNAPRIYRAIDIPGLETPGTTKYFSFLIQLSDPEVEGRVEFSNNDDSVGNGLRIQSLNGDFIATARGGQAIDENLGATNTDTQFAVFRVDFRANGTDIALFWNPSDLTSEPTSPTASGSLGAGNLYVEGFFENLVLNRRGGDPAGGDGFMVDEFRIATTWDDAISVIPEPSTYAGIFGAIALGALLLKCRLARK